MPSTTCPTGWRRCTWSRARNGSSPFTAGGGSRGPTVIFKARYRGLGPTSKTAEIRPGSLEYFFSERNCVFSTNRAGQPIRANLHHVPWPLEDAEAEIERNDLAAAVGITLPKLEPVLHYSRRLAVYVWPAELLLPALAARPVTVAATPT